jgi:CspA family cold shock protein
VRAGTVKWLHPTKGFGFIKPDVGESDVYVHAELFRACGLAVPLVGQRICFEVGEHKGRPAAVNLRTGKNISNQTTALRFAR